MLKKELETANKQFEYREQMASYYYIEEVNSLNDNVNAIMQKNIVSVYKKYRN